MIHSTSPAQTCTTQTAATAAAAEPPEYLAAVAASQLGLETGTQNVSQAECQHKHSTSNNCYSLAPWQRYCTN